MTATAGDALSHIGHRGFLQAILPRIRRRKFTRLPPWTKTDCRQGRLFRPQTHGSMSYLQD